MQKPATGSSPPPEGRGDPGRRTRVGLAMAPLLAFAALAVLFAISLKSGDPSRLPSALIGKPVPATAFPPVEGLVAGGRPVAGFDRAALVGGGVTVVNFWASWCVPCVQEHPLLTELARRPDIRVYGVNYKDDPAAARRFLGRYGNPFAAVGADASGRAAIEWGVYGMPETFVIDGEGRIAYKHVGPISPESLEKKVIPAIEAARR